MALDPNILTILANPLASDYNAGTFNFSDTLQKNRALNQQEARDANTAAQDERRTQVIEATEKRRVEEERRKIEEAGKTEAMETYAQDIVAARSLYGSGDIESTRKLLLDRASTLNQQRKENPSINTRNTEGLINLLETDPQKFGNVLESEFHKLGATGFVDGYGANKSGNKSFAPVTLVNPKTGEKVFRVPTIDNATGQARLAEVDLPEGFRIMTETPEQKRSADVLAAQQKVIDRLDAELDKKPKTAQAVALAQQAAAKADQYFTQIDKVRTNIVNLKDALQAVRDGAGTGAIERLLPSFRAASVALDAAQGRLGLDVVQATTFGALSKGELDLSKAIALPTGLDGPELEKWIVDKIAAQENVSSYLEKQAIFLSETDEEGNPNTVADWVKKEKAIMDQAMEGITDEDIEQTMKDNDMDRSEVLREIRRRFESGGA